MGYQIEAGRLIRHERNRLGMTLDDLARAIGCSKAQLSQMETGGRTISEERAAAIERALSIEDGRIVAAVRWASVPAALRGQMQALMEQSRLLRGKRKRGGSADARENSDDVALRAMMSLGRIPVINKVAAGYPAEFTDLDYPASVADEYIACPDVSDPQAFAARVVGDSMEPDYKEGEIVVFSPALPTPSGSDCFVRLEKNNETTFKRVFFEGREGGDASDIEFVRLQPVNAEYPPTVVHREAITGLWAAAYVMRKVDRRRADQ